MSNPPKRRALGRGLSALIPGATPTGTGTPAAAAPERADYFQAPIEEIYPSPDQPRRRFEEAALEELAQSIRAHGVIQPVIVRARDGGGFLLIAGERRWRAAQRAGLHRIPAVVQDASPKEAFERALVENLQRSDLNPIEEAQAYDHLMTEFSYTQAQVADRVGKDRSTVANSLRLLKLPRRLRGWVEDGTLSTGHAKALLALDDAAAIERAADAVQKRGLSVRATEALVKQRDRPAPRAPAAKSASVRDVQERLTKALGAEVEVTQDDPSKPDKGGKIVIRYRNLDDFDRLFDHLMRPVR